MRSLLGLLVLALASCAPVLQSQSRPSPAPLLVAGGLVQGGWANVDNEQFPLSGQPLAAAYASGRLYAAYPYQLQVYKNGTLEQSFSMTGTPTAIHTLPKPVVVMRQGLFLPGAGVFSYPAKDALSNSQGLWWVGRGGLWLGEKRIVQGEFQKVVGSDNIVIALGRNQAAAYPSGERFPLPQGWLGVAFLKYLYVLTPTGVREFSKSGLELARTSGQFEAIRADGNGVWLLQGDRLLHLSLSLGAV